MRLFSAASSCSSRLVTTSRRKWRKCQRICFRSRRSGRPTSGFCSGHEAGEVHREVDLQRRVLEEVRHDHLLVGVLLHLEGDAHVLGREVLHVEQLRQLAAEDDVGDAFDELRLVHRVGNAVDVDRLRRARFRPDVPRAAQADRARAGPVDLLQLVRRIQDLAAGREVGALHVAAQLRVADVLVVEQLDERRAHFVQVVRRDVRRHPDGDAGGAVHEQVRNARGQDDRLGLRAVVVGTEVHRRLLDFGEHLVADARQAALGVAHRRRAVAVERPEVARAVDERVAQREGLRHADERLVERRVAVRVEVAHHVADHRGALAVLVVGGQVLLPHREEDAALHRLEAVADVGQRARRDDRQRVVEIPRLRRLVQRDMVRRPAAAPGRRLSARRGWRGCRRLTIARVGRLHRIEKSAFVSGVAFSQTSILVRGKGNCTNWRVGELESWRVGELVSW